MLPVWDISRMAQVTSKEVKSEKSQYMFHCHNQWLTLITIGKSHIGKSHIGKSHIGKSHIGKPHIGKSHIGKSHIDKSHIGKSHWNVTIDKSQLTSHN